MGSLTPEERLDGIIPLMNAGGLLGSGREEEEEAPWEHTHTQWWMRRDAQTDRRRYTLRGWLMTSFHLEAIAIAGWMADWLAGCWLAGCLLIG